MDHDHAEYCGPLRELNQLARRTALVRPDPDCPEDATLEERTLLAQFDGNGDWRVQEEFKLTHPETGELLCYGWHRFPVTHFMLLIPVRV